MSIPLSPIDHVFTGRGSYPIEFVFSYDGELDEARLRQSLAQAVEVFPPASSRLVRRDGAFGLEPSPDGLAFSTAESEIGFLAADDRTLFLDPVATFEGEPLTRVRLTRTPQGSVLGVSQSHAVGDGFSYFHFLSCWSRLFRGEPFEPPSHERRRLIPSAEADDGEPTPSSVLRDTGLFWQGRRAAVQGGPLRWERHQLSRARLKEILGEAQRDSPVRLTHNDAVSAWLWRESAASWGAEAQDDTYLSCPVDHRRLLPELPATYFGNAVVLATVESTIGALGAAPLAELAQRVRAAVSAVDEARVRRSLGAIDRLRRLKGVAVLEECHVMHPQRGLLVTNLSRLPVREIDFGAGPPTAFDILTAVPRGAVVLPAPDGLDVRVCLPGEAG
jgi:omega-hydroxypalmitate O-feruloyl transferase